MSDGEAGGDPLATIPSPNEGMFLALEISPELGLIALVDDDENTAAAIWQLEVCAFVCVSCLKCVCSLVHTCVCHPVNAFPPQIVTPSHDGLIRNACLAIGNAAFHTNKLYNTFQALGVIGKLTPLLKVSFWVW